MISSAAGWVLAGGGSTRMGQDKALLNLEGRTLVEMALDKLRALGLQPRIAGSRPDLARFAPFVADLHPGCGPLSGIEAALAANTQPLNLFVPVDVPLLPAEILALLLERASLTGALVTVPSYGGRLQPLTAIYHRDLLPAVSQALTDGDYKVTRVMQAAALVTGQGTGAIDIIAIETLATARPELHASSPWPLRHWFQNCNTPDEFAVLRHAARNGAREMSIH